MRRKIYNLTALLIFSLAISGCGFHLAHYEPLPNSLKKIYIENDLSSYDRFSLKLKHALKVRGVTIENTKSRDSATLTISAISFTHSGSDNSLTAQTRIYTFTYSVTFGLKDNNMEIIPPKVITTSRTLTLNPNEVLNASNQVGIFRNEAEREVIEKIMNQLSAKIAQATPTPLRLQ